IFHGVYFESSSCGCSFKLLVGTPDCCPAIVPPLVGRRTAAQWCGSHFLALGPVGTVDDASGVPFPKDGQGAGGSRGFSAASLFPGGLTHRSTHGASVFGHPDRMV